METPTKRIRRRPVAQPFPPGTRVGAIRVLSQSVESPIAKGRRWRVRYDCCGLEVERSYATLLAFLNGPPHACQQCCRRGPLPANAPAPVAAPAPSVHWLGHAALASADPGGAWPRPPSLVGQAPGIWGVQP